MEKIKSILIIAVYFIVIDFAFTQPQTEWVQRYNSPGNYNDYVTDMAIDKSGNVYLTGYVNINDTNQNIITIKYNTIGVQQWVRYYDSPDHREDLAGSIAVDDSGNVFVIGYSYSYSEFDDILTIKYNKNGDSIWTRKFIGVGQVSDRPNAMTIDKHGNVYITGGGIICSLCPQDIITICYKSNGDLKWVNYFNGIGNGYDIANDIKIDKNNVVYVSGGATGKGGIVLEYDSIGNQLRTFSSPNYFGNKLLLDSNLNIFLGFDSYGGLTSGYDIAVAKINSNGNLNWVRSYNNSSTNNNDYFRAMCLDNFGNVTVTGISGSIEQLTWDIATIKYNSNGDTLWIKRYNPPGSINSNDESFDIASDKFGNIYVTGTSDSGFVSRMITIKYSLNGLQEWRAYYNNNNPANWHSGVKVLTDTLGNIYVSGRSLGNGTGVDIVTIKYSSITNYQNLSSLIPKEFNLYQNFPNPFNPRTLINYDLPVSSEISLKVYNSFGKEIMTLVNEVKNAGLYRVEFNGSNLSSGVYFYTLSANGIAISAKKLILLK